MRGRHMRVATEHRLVSAEPGQTVDVRVDVVNTGELIEGVTARLIGLPQGQITVEPQLLPLFPDAQGQITLSVGVPTSLPAGLHPLTIEVVSHGSGSPTQHVDVDLSVSARPDVRLSTSPQTVRSKRSARFVVTVENTGNVGLDADLRAGSDDQRTTTRFSPETVHVEPGQAAPVILGVRGPRMLTGSEVDRTVTLDLTARRAHTIPAMDETETGPELERQAVVRLRQRPRISRGLLTALILMSIVALWATVFLLGLTQVFASDPMTKAAPPSFFPASAATGDSTEAAAAVGAGGSDAEAAPAGAMPKTGLLPAGVGGEVAGTVTSASDGLPTGRITVQAYRQGRHGLQLVSSAATQSDGTYSLAGLFPTAYRLKFSAAGYRAVWYPAAPSQAGANAVPVAAQGKSEGIDAVIEGRPGSISGTIDPGDSLQPVRTTVVARMTGAATGDTEPVARTVSNGTSYTLDGLPAPATYELSFTADGYQATKVVTTVGGGEDRLQSSVVLSAGTGRISGTVTDGGVGLGNVTVSTTVGGSDVSVITPTTGQVGAFVLDNLPTPGTYVLSVSAPDHGSRSMIIDLEAGQSRTGLQARLRAGTGSVSGMVVGPDGQGMGGAQVWVGGSIISGGAADPDSVPSTTTLTTGAVGSFTISGLATPGDYTLTITRDGFAPETVPVSLSGTGPAPTVKVTLGTELGAIRGTVTGPGGQAYVGATVTATNGTQSWTTTSSSPGGALSRGGYLFGSMPPGTYSVTVTADGIRQRTGLVRVASGETSVQDFRLGAAG
jgi:5-hydroxyisourate hydrolase-like protein (transthyretin family)